MSLNLSPISVSRRLSQARQLEAQFGDVLQAMQSPEFPDRVRGWFAERQFMPETRHSYVAFLCSLTHQVCTPQMVKHYRLWLEQCKREIPNQDPEVDPNYRQHLREALQNPSIPDSICVSIILILEEGLALRPSDLINTRVGEDVGDGHYLDLSTGQWQIRGLYTKNRQDRQLTLSPTTLAKLRQYAPEVGFLVSTLNGRRYQTTSTFCRNFRTYTGMRFLVARHSAVSHFNHQDQNTVQQIKQQAHKLGHSFACNLAKYTSMLPDKNVTECNERSKNLRV